MRIEKVNGSTLIMYPAPHRFTDYLRLCFVLPLNERTATSAAILENLIKHGTKRYPSRLLLMRALEEHYGMVVSFDNYRKGDIMIFKAAMTSPDGARIPDGGEWRRKFLRLFSELLMEPHTPGGRFPPHIFELEKKNHISYLRSLINYRSSYSRHRFELHLFAGEPAATPPDGTVSASEELTQKMMLDFLRTIRREAPLLVFAHGHITYEELYEELSPLLCQRPSPKERTLLRNARSEPLQVTETLPGLEQAHIWVGFRAKIPFSDPRIDPLAVGVALYGSTGIGRLFRRVREEMGLAYDSSASYIRTKGALVAWASVHPHRYHRAIDALLAEFNDLSKGNIGKDEFDMAKGLLVEQIRSACDSAGFLADFYTTTLLFGGEEQLRKRGLDAVLEGIMRVRRDDVVHALSLFKPDTIYAMVPERGR